MNNEQLGTNEYRSKSGRFYGVGRGMTQATIDRYDRGHDAIVKRLPPGEWTVTAIDRVENRATLTSPTSGSPVTVRYPKNDEPELGWRYTNGPKDARGPRG